MFPLRREVVYSGLGPLGRERGHFILIRLDELQHLVQLLPLRPRRHLKAG